jgi:putative ABC transport system permease protein
MRNLKLLLRWSWRDLKAHWAKVLAISVVIAIGTGGYAGLTSTTRWRQVSYDASYSQLAMYDLRVDLATGSLIDEGALYGALDRLEHRDWVVAAEERLIVPTQVDASTGGTTVLVRGEITGSDFSLGGPAVNGYYPFTGRILDESDAGEPTAMLERSFSKSYDLPATGTFAVSGDRRLSFVGQVTTPEYFAVAPEGEMFMTEATFAGVFTTLQTAQELAAAPGQVNNMVLTLAAAADRGIVATELEAALDDLAVGTTVSTRDDNLSYTALTTDIDQDQAMFNALALLLIAGAVGAAFNLIHRLAEQQRREIGIGMALGVRPGLLAVRPLLVSAQIALLGVTFGVVVGSLIGGAMGSVFEEFIPLPVWDTSFQTAVFARVALVGFLVPFVATSIPVWRAVRVAPIEAIKPSYLKSRGPRRRRRSSRNTFRHMPLRNLARAPRRTALTMLGIGAALTVLVGFLGIMDSVFDAVDTAEAEARWVNPERISVALDGFYPVDSPVIEAIDGADSVGRIETTLRLTGRLKGDIEIDTSIDIADFQGGLSRPSVTEGALPDGDGILLSEKAAADLGVGVGESVTLRHPQRQGMTSFSFVDSEVKVVGTHPHPIRGFSYMSISSASTMGLAGITNSVSILPTDAAVTTTDVQKELFAVDAVASVQSVTAVTEAVRDAFEQLLGIVQVMVVFVLLLALLIAFNAAAINLDARAREHATMFAFGVRLRTAMRIAMTESFMVAVVATIIGIGGGLAMVWWMTQRLLPETLPDFALKVAISQSTLGLVVVMGVLAVTLAPLLTIRRLRRMDLPGTLRFVE